MFATSENAKKRVYEMFDRTEEIVNEDVKIVKKWMETQPHLPEIMDDVKIKNFLNLNKFSIEKTKQKIDMYYTTRSLMPDLFSMSNPKLERMQRLLDKMHLCIFPEPLDGIHRVVLAKMKEKNVTDLEQFTMCVSALFEVRLYEDFMFSDIFIYDMNNVTFNDLKKMTPSLLKQLAVLYQKVYSFRFKNMYLVNSLPFVSSVLSIVKMIVKPKIFERIEVHKDYKILHEILPKEQVPADFGGSGPSLQELSDKLRQKFSQYQERFDLLDTLRVDASLRPEKLDNDEVLGFYGNFRKLEVD